MSPHPLLHIQSRLRDGVPIFFCEDDAWIESGVKEFGLRERFERMTAQQRAKHPRRPDTPAKAALRSACFHYRLPRLYLFVNFFDALTPQDNGWMVFWADDVVGTEAGERATKALVSMLPFDADDKWQIADEPGAAS